ncbi:MAG: HYR domain-containing protein, partial [Thaumarchaeota archaeon S14]
MTTKHRSRTTAAAALSAALVALTLFATDPAWALTVTPPPPCVIELKSPLTTWGKADCGTATPSPVAATVTSSARDADALPEGITLVKWTASLPDATASAWQAVVVADTVPPTIGLPPPFHIAATGATTSPPAAFGSTEFVAPTGHTSVTCDSPGQLKIGITRITCTTKDASDNSAATTWAAVVTDVTPPTITVPATKAEVAATAALSPHADLTFVKPAVADLVTETPTLSYFSPTSHLPLGDSTITWIATDEAGNHATAQQTIALVDTTAPTMTAATRVRVPPNSLVGSPQVFDAIDPSPALSSQYTGTDQNPTVTWTATDKHKNASVLIQSATRPATEPRFTMTLLHTLQGPVNPDLVGDLDLVSDKYLIYTGPISRSDIHGRGILVFNPNTGARIALPENTEWTDATRVTPIRKDATDHQFAAHCDCDTSGNGVHIFNAAMPTATHTLAPPQLSDGRTVHFGAMASSGNLLFVQAYTAEPTSASTQRWIGRVLAYDTETWKLKYEIENPTPAYGDQFGKLLWVGQGTTHSKEALYVWSRQSALTPDAFSPEIQVFNTADGQFIRTTTNPQIATPFNRDPLESLDMVGHANGVFVSTRTYDNEVIINYKKDGTTGLIYKPSCCTWFFGNGFESDGSLLYASAWTPMRERILLVFDAETNTLVRTYTTRMNVGSGLWGTFTEVEYLGNNKVATIEATYGSSTDRVRIFQLNPTTPAPAAASAQASADTITLVKPLLLYAEPVDNKSIRLVYDTALSPHAISALDYEMNAGYRITAVNATEDSVLITYASATPKPTNPPAVYEVG